MWSVAMVRVVPPRERPDGARLLERFPAERTREVGRLPLLPLETCAGERSGEIGEIVGAHGRAEESRGDHWRSYLPR